MVVDIIFNVQAACPMLLSFVIFFLLVIYFTRNKSGFLGHSSINNDHKLNHFRNLPSPPGYPILGHLVTLGHLPHLRLTKWSKKYGSLFKIKMGFKEVLVISGKEMIKKALTSSSFGGRPDMETTKLISEGLSLTFSDFSPIWEHQKIAAKAAMGRYTTGKDSCKRSVMEASSFKHANSLVEQLLQVAKKQDGIINPRNYILTSASIAICQVCFGKDFNPQNSDLKELLSINRNFDAAMAASQPINFWPVLKYFPFINQAYKNLKVYSDSYWRLVTSMLSSHWETYDEKNMRDLVDCLYHESERERCNNNNKVPKPDQNGFEYDHNQLDGTDSTSTRNNNLMTESNYENIGTNFESTVNPFCVVDESVELELKKRITYNIGDIFGAGYDTMFTIIHWAFLYMAVFPDTQNKVRNEVDRAILPNEAPSFRLHSSKCPYTMAWIYELMRHCTPSPMLIPHKTTRDVTFGNCFIPAGVTVYFNIWEAHKDPRIWNDPETFNPLRFLNEKHDGTLSLKQNCTSNLLSWGAGTRKCLGHELSKHQLFIFLSTVVRKLILLPSRPGIEPALPWPVTFGLTLKPNDFKIRVSKR